MKSLIAVVLIVALGYIAIRPVSSKRLADQRQMSGTAAAKSGQTAGHSQIDLNELICITPQRISVPLAQMTLCAKPPSIGPHEVPEILIYANQTALDYKRSHPDIFDYPVGSKFVKTKYANLGDQAPNAATMMVRKASRGEISDWEFSSYSLPDEKRLGPTNDSSCIECHEGFVDRGFVSWETEGALRRHLKLE